MFGKRKMTKFRIDLAVSVLAVVLVQGPTYCQGQSNFYFGQPENRFVPNFPNGAQGSGSFFDQNRFSNQFRPNVPEYAQQHQQIYNNQREQAFGRQPATAFQTQTGRGQTSSQFFLNHADFPSFQSNPETPKKSNRPTSFQINNHPASTVRPNFPQYAQTSHNHDPSKPETFLGQITINNPFPESPRELQAFNDARHRQQNADSFHSNILRTNPLDSLDFQPGFPNAAEPVNQDLYDYSEKTKPTTYNPTKIEFSSKIKPGKNAFNSRPSFFDSQKHDDHNTLQQKPFINSNENYFNSNENNFGNGRNRFKPKTTTVATTSHTQHLDRKNKFSPSTKPTSKPLAYNIRVNKVAFSPSRPLATTEYKPLFDLEPLLEDEIPDAKYFGDSLRSRSNGSEDVQVIKSAEVLTTISPVSEEIIKTTLPSQYENTTPTNDDVPIKSQDNLNYEYTTDHSIAQNDQEFKPSLGSSVTVNENEHKHHITNTTDDPDASETPDYYDDGTEYVDENEDEYTKNSENDHENVDKIHNTENFDYITTTISEPFDVLTMKPKPVMVKDDNFKGFVDSGLIDNTEPPSFVTEQYMKPNTNVPKTTVEEYTTEPLPILLGEEVVSVVTTKSVINGTFKIPEIENESTVQMQSTTESFNTTENHASNVTESWMVVASVQTSRSVSGARFLPFPAVSADGKDSLNIDDNSNETTTKIEITTLDTATEEQPTDITYKTPQSTESIIDKLDRVQSELSSGFLSGGFKGSEQNFPVLTEMPHENNKKDEVTTPSPPPQIFTVKSTTTTSTTEKTPPEPLPVTIKKFSPYARPSTTTPKPKPKSLFDNIKVDDLSGLLPPGFKPRNSFKDKKITTTTEKFESNDNSSNEKNQNNDKHTIFNKVVIRDDISALLPKGYTPPKAEKPTSIEDLFKNLKSDEINKFLPPGYKPPTEEKSVINSTEKPKNNKSNLLSKAEPLDITAFLPKGYKLMTTTTEKTTNSDDSTTDKKPLPVIKTVDISSFLPPGYKLKPEPIPNKNSSILSNLSNKNVSSSLSPKLETNNTTSEEHSTTIKPTEKPSNGFKVVFPSRPGAGKPGKRLTTPKSTHEGGMGGATPPSIHKGWPTRVTTEFTGWPTPITTQFSIQRLLEEQQKAATAKHKEVLVETTTPTSTSSTTITVTSPSTTIATSPGICNSQCDLAATIKIVGGVKWVPELLDHNTKEWQLLANEVSKELDAAYSKSQSLKKWYKGIRIDSFSKGSVLVDYFVELNEINEKIDTVELKKLFHKSLNEARPGTVFKEIEKPVEQPDKITGRKIDSFDPDMMVGDEPYEARLEKAEPVKERIDLSQGKLEIGKFILDPIYTEFIVLPKRTDPPIGYAEDNTLLPQWGIAVIVIALASLLFVVIFGVTVLVNRQKSAKAKQPIPLSEDMLRELDKSHMGGTPDDLYMQDHEPPYPPRNHKRGSTLMLDSLAYPGNPGDSWRSEWGPYYNQYHAQHYAPDSGRGSQSYTGGNNYGYSGSQLYGYNGGGGSQNYGYSGEGVRTLYPRRRSDFDSNF